MLPVNYIKFLCTLCLAWPLLVTAQGIRIPGSSYVIANHGNIVTQEKWINNGRFTANGGTIVFAGSTQQINGTSSTSFHKLTISSGSNTTIASSGHSVKQLLKSDGTLNAGNNLTLLANATQTALIDGSGAGEVLGNLTMQGWLANGFGYKYLGSPFQAATVNEMSDDVNLSSSFAAVYKFDENQASNGWITYTTATDTLKPMRGYLFQMGTDLAAKTIDMTGVVNNGNLSLTLYNNNQAYTKGFNLVSNPYPSPVNWDASSGWTKTNIDNTIYYFNTNSTDQYGGTYSSYINGVSSDDTANNIIPAMQGFFVHVSEGTIPVTGTLGVSNATRITSTPTVYRKLNGGDPVPLLRLWATFTGNARSDATVIYFQNTATKKFDKNLDALKLMNNTAGVPNLYSLTADAKKLSINALPEPDSSIRVPLGIHIMLGGKVSFFTTDTKALPAGLYGYLYDAVKDYYHNLKDNSHYLCELPAGIHEQRFSVVFSRKPILQQPVTAEPTATDLFRVAGAGRNLQLILNTAPGEKSVIRIINTAGQVLFTKTYTQGGSYPVSLLVPKGIYLVACYTNHTVITKKIFL
ncbi:MAG: T9SS type A sorting domain-containing protein [Sediminibacterium sp.]|nr:T9SS type A sorting domain-containing protein [Sediminibacterium sp.]